MTAPRKRPESFVATLVDDEVVLIDMEGGELFSLSGTARAVWEAIDGQASADEIARSMAQAYEVEPDTAQREVSELLGELAKAGLISC